MISFLVKDSSFAFVICSSMLERSSQGSTKPECGALLDYSKNDPLAILSFTPSQQLAHIPESISAVIFSGAELISGSMCAFLQMASSSNLFLRTSSFILLAFCIVSLSTSSSV